MRLRERILKHLPYLGLLAAVHVFIYRDYWLGRMIFNGSDLFQQVVPLVNYQSDCLRDFSWPFWNPFMNFGYPWIEHYVNSSLFPTHLLLGLFTRFTFMIMQIEILSWITLGGVGVYLCAYELGVSRRAALISGVCFMFCGQLIALPTWNNNIYNACCFPFLILGYHRFRRQAADVSLISIAFLTLAILGGNIASSMLGIYFFIGYVMIDSLRRKELRSGMIFLFSTIALSALIASPKIWPLYNSLGASPRFDFSNQPGSTNLDEIISVYNLMSWFLPVKYYFSLYIGEISIITFLYALLRKKLRLDSLMLMTLLSASLLMFDSNGNPSFVRNLADAVLPFIKPMRQEFTFWYYPSFFAILFTSRHIDDFIESENIMKKITAVMIFNGLLGIFFFFFYNVSFYYKSFITQLVLSLAWLALGLMYKRSRLQTVMVVALLSFEMFAVFNRVSIDEPPVYGKGYMEITTKHQWHSSQSFLNPELFRESWKVRITPDHLRPTLQDSRQWPHLVSLTTGSPNPNWAEAMNMKQFTGWWYNTQERREFILLMKTPFFLQLDNQPLFSLFSRHTGELTGRTSFDAISCSSFVFSVNAAEPGFFLLNQMYDDRWKVLVDGREQPLRRANEYFMGAEIEPGVHAIAFRFRDTTFMIFLAISGITIVLLSIYLVFRKCRKTKQNDGALLQHKSSS